MTTLNLPIRLRRGNQADLPATLLPGEVYLCLDTGAIFAGNATGTGTKQVGGGGAAPSGAGNLVYATPNGSSGSALLRALVTADIPSLPYDASGAAATAQNNAEAYALALGSNYDASGSAATAQSNAESYAAGLSLTIDGDGTVLSASGVTIQLGHTGSLTLVSQAKNTALMGPTTGSNAAPTFRGLALADLPSKYVSGSSGFIGGIGDSSWCQNTSIGNSAQTANTQFAWLFYLEQPITVSKASIYCNAGSAGTTASIGICNTSGTKLVDSGTFATTSQGIKSNSFSAVTLPAGYYWYIFTVSSASPTFLYFQTGSQNLLSLLNQNGTRLGTCSGATTGGALNSSLGTVTAGANGNVLPIGFFE